VQLQNQLQRGANALQQPQPAGIDVNSSATGSSSSGTDAARTSENHSNSSQVQPVGVQRGRTVPVARVQRLSSAVEDFLEAHGLQHSIQTAESPWPYSSQKPPTNPVTRHAACGVSAPAVIKCWFLSVATSDTCGDAEDWSSNSATTTTATTTTATTTQLVWLVAAGSATVNLAAVAKALGIEDATRVRLANRQQLSTSSLCMDGHETDLVYSSKKFRLCPPLVALPAPIDVVVMSELMAGDGGGGKESAGNSTGTEEGQQQQQQQQQQSHYVEVGFGRYAILSTDELRRALHIAAAGADGCGGGGGPPAQGNGGGGEGGGSRAGGGARVAAAAAGHAAGKAGRLLEVAGLQASTDQRGQTLC
jgi:uncharacterized membrane protein YgcG